MAVTGVRHDQYALHHPVVVEEDKVETQRGRYLHPAKHGVPETVASSAPRADRCGRRLKRTGARAAARTLRPCPT
jgi:hypothetical protein